MSEENVQSSAEENSQPIQESNPVEGKFVSADAYKQVSADMHKFKSQKKELSARLNELETKLKSEEETRLEEQNRYKELYEAAKREREEAIASREADRARAIELNKRIALKQELGAVNDSYLVHARLAEIEINEDGSLNSESVKAVANRFREEHASLLPQSNASNITNSPSPSTPGVDLSFEEALKAASTQREFEAVRKKYNRN